MLKKNLINTVCSKELGDGLIGYSRIQVFYRKCSVVMIIRAALAGRVGKDLKVLDVVLVRLSIAVAAVSSAVVASDARQTADALNGGHVGRHCWRRSGRGR